MRSADGKSLDAVERLRLVLDESCHGYAGRTLCARPRYGWGWTRGGHGSMPFAEYQLVEDAGPFAIRVDELWSWRGELRGIVGVVTTAEHLFANLHIVAALMLGPGPSNFTDKVCGRYDLQLGTTRPTRDEWPIIEQTTCHYEGSAIIAAAFEHIEAFLD